MSKKEVKIVQKEGEELAPEVLAISIQKIADAMQAFSKSRLKRDTIIKLIHVHSKVAKRDIEIVLNNLDNFDKIWLK